MALIKGKQIGNQTVTISGSTGNVIVSGLLDTNGNQVFVNVAPSNDNHLANKAYVDALAQGVRPHAPVVVVSTNNITLSGLQTIDGVTLTASDRVLVAGQTTLSENGIYSASSGAWSRAEDADGTPANEVQLGDFSFVMSGTTNGNSGWVLGKSDTSTAPDIVPGTDTQEWYKMAAPGSYSADGEGLELTGSQFALELDGTTLSKSGSGLKLNDTLSTTISTNTTNVTSLSTALSVEISSTNSDVTSIESYVDEISNSISSNDSDITSLNTALSNEIDATNTDVTSLSSALSNEISQTNFDVNKLSTDISNNDSDITSLSSALSNEINSANGDVTSLSSALSNEIDATNTDVTSLSTALSSVSGDTLDITTILNNGEVLGLSGGELTGFTYDTDITSLETAIGGDSSSLETALSVEISSTNSDVSSLEEEISTSHTSIETAIGNGDSSLTTALSVEISSTNSDVTSLDSAIDQLDIDISTDIASLETSIGNGDSSLTTAISTEIVSTDGDFSSIEEEISTSHASIETAIDNINNPEIISETITPSNAGSTSSVVVSTTTFGYGTGVVDVDSVTVYLNGIQYPFTYASGSSVFHTNGTTPSGTNITLYFDGTVAGFGIETDDTVIVKYMVVT